MEEDGWKLYSNIYPTRCNVNTVYLYLETALHVSGGTITHHQEHKQLSTASGICRTITAICRYRGRVGVTVRQIPDAVDTVVCAPDNG
jgi:hypothetical protein